MVPQWINSLAQKRCAYMKRLIIDGNSVYEIDLDCVKKHRPPEGCELAGHLKDCIDRDDRKSSGTLKDSVYQDKM